MFDNSSFSWIVALKLSQNVCHSRGSPWKVLSVILGKLTCFLLVDGACDACWFDLTGGFLFWRYFVILVLITDTLSCSVSVSSTSLAISSSDSSKCTILESRAVISFSLLEIRSKIAVSSADSSSSALIRRSALFISCVTWLLYALLTPLSRDSSLGMFQVGSRHQFWERNQTDWVQVFIFTPAEKDWFLTQLVLYDAH